MITKDNIFLYYIKGIVQPKIIQPQVFSNLYKFYSVINVIRLNTKKDI